MYGTVLFENTDYMYRSHNHLKDICLNFVPQILGNFIFFFWWLYVPIFLSYIPKI